MFHCHTQTIIKIAFINYSDAILWNGLPCDIREVDSLRQLKCQLKKK